MVGGLHTNPALITHHGRQSGIQLMVDPLASRSLFGMPASELADIDLDARDVLGVEATLLRERLLEAHSWTERFSLLDVAISHRLARDGTQCSPQVAFTWRRLVATGGCLAVAELATSVGGTRRWLHDRFLAEVGLAPKTAARIIRFDRARRHLRQRAVRRQPSNLADLALAHGFYDQAHLVREFKALAAASPRRWLRDEFPNVQSIDPGPVADSDS